VALVVLALAFSGCGSGGDKTETTALTKAELIKQGDKICDKANERQSAQFKIFIKTHDLEDLKGSPSKKQQEEIVTAVGLPPIEAEIEELKDLEARGSQKAQLRKVIGELENVVAKVEGDPAAAMTQAAAITTDSTKLAREFGFKVCGEI
jgi:hypothetical protein